MGEKIHVERLSEPIERIIDLRTAAEIGVGERYGGGLLVGPGGEWTESEGALDAKQGYKKEANHEEFEDQIRRGSRVIHAIDRQPIITIINNVLSARQTCLEVHVHIKGSIFLNVIKFTEACSCRCQ